MSDESASRGSRGISETPTRLASTDTDEGDVPVSRRRIENCLDSAGFWVQELPRYADREQRWADFWALLAGVVSAVTGLSIWPLLTESTFFGQALLSAAALFAAISALIPRIFNYGEMAGQARELTSRYGRVLGDLLDIDQSRLFDSDTARRVVEEYEAIKERKDSLRRLPDKAKVQIERANFQAKVAEAEARAAAAKRGAVSG